jgi:hypothetical protein
MRWYMPWPEQCGQSSPQRSFIESQDAERLGSYLRHGNELSDVRDSFATVYMSYGVCAWLCGWKAGWTMVRLQE